MTEIKERGLYRNGRLWWVRTVRAPLLNASRALSTGTSLLKRANAVKRMLDTFAENPTQYEWLSRAVRDNVPLDTIYVHHAAGTLAQLRAQLDAPQEIDLDAWAKKFIDEYVQSLDAAPATKTQIEHYVRYFIPAAARFPVSKLDADYVQTKLSEIIGARHDETVVASNSTRRQYLVALRQFVGYCLRKKVLATDPIADVPWPKKQAPRTTYYEFSKVKLVLSHVTNPEHRAALALMFGSGIELGALLAMRGEHVGSPAERTVVALGTKNIFRESRTIFVDAWAWAIFYEHARRILPKAAVWHVTPSGLRRSFYNAQVAAGLVEKPVNEKWHTVKPHTLHDCRHSYCVNRSLGLDGEAPRDASFLSAQLGHADETMVLRIYKKLNIPERLRLAQVAATAQQPRAVPALGLG